MSRPVIAALAGALLLGGCAAVGPDYHLPAEAVANAPAAQGAFVSTNRAITTAPLPDHWWKLFNDPVLDHLVERALAANTDLRVADANLERSVALLAEARSGREVGTAADMSTSWGQASAEAVQQQVQPPEHQTYNGGIAISYDADLFGRIRRGVEAAQADEEVAIAARDLVRVNVAAETTRAYADLCNAGRAAELLRRLVALQEQDLRLTRKLVANGRAPAFDAQRQIGTLAATRSRLPQVEAAQRNSAYRITTLMGLPPARFDPGLLACHTPLALRAPLPVGDGGALLRRRPDVRAAERRVAAATARIGVATAALYPDIRFGASLGSTGATPDLLSPLTNRFGFGPMISWDLHRSAVRARISAAEAGTKASLAAFDGTVLAALRETESALETYGGDLEQLHGLEQARDAARQVEQRTAELRRGGKVGGLDTLDAARSYVAAEQAVAMAEAQINRDQIALFLALGGGWSQPDKNASEPAG
ncbi:MAG: efflux transporter outer membrane subunit [Sphingomonas sp.]